MPATPYTCHDYESLAEIVKGSGLGAADGVAGGREMILAALTRAAHAAAQTDGGGKAWRRVYEWTTGRTLTADDINDLQKVLADHIDLQTARQVAADQICAELIVALGGDELLAAVATNDTPLRQQLVQRCIADMSAMAATVEGVR